jgi:hypothetical protein
MKISDFVETQETLDTIKTYVMMIHGKDPFFGTDENIETITEGVFHYLHVLYNMEHELSEDEKLIKISEDMDIDKQTLVDEYIRILVVSSLVAQKIVIDKLKNGEDILI